MRIRGSLYIWLLIIHIALLVLVIFLFRESNTTLLLVSEFAIFISLLFSVLLVRRTLKPVNIIRRGLDLLREEDFTSTLVEVGHKDVDELIKVYNNMIYKLREEKITVREQHHFLDLLIKSSPMGLIVTDFDDRITSMNPASERILGIKFTDYEGRHVSDLPGYIARSIETLTFGEKVSLSNRDLKLLVHRDFFMDRGFRHPFFLIEELTDEIRKAEKQAYGKVIRMMAHEVNNTIGSVNSIISAVEHSPDFIKPDEKDEVTGILKVALERNKQLNRFMQNFSDIVKLPLPEKELYGLNDSILLVLDSYAPVFSSKDIEVVTELADPSPSIKADRSQMEQVVANVVKNAVEAMESGGTLTLVTIQNPTTLRIRDTGRGIPENIKSQLFTPFFTTKNGGQGIGLTFVREILINHGFRFDLHTTRNKETEFVIEF
ncbi:MAG: PAS domain-containing protein [Bacteroidales bacterium]|nr:MAG: PAS domain-containing protein [Bacteroidales bacterium]